jgi:hypothetical protein
MKTESRNLIEICGKMNSRKIIIKKQYNESINKIFSDNGEIDHLTDSNKDSELGLTLLQDLFK